MSPFDDAGAAKRYGFPRVSGDEPSVIMTGIARALFSPRERG